MSTEFDRVRSEARIAHVTAESGRCVVIPRLAPPAIEWWTTLAQLRPCDA